MGATQDSKYCRMSPHISELISKDREARAGAGRKKIKKVIYRPKQSFGIGGPDLAFSGQRMVFA